MPMRGGHVASVDATRFAMTPRPDVPRSAFTVRHGHKTTLNAGLLIPIYVDSDILPGDSLRLNMSAFCRLSTPLFPIMDNLEMETFFFFVPHRLVWSNWQRFMGEQTSPSDTTPFLVPYTDIVNGDLLPGGSVADYMGITVNGSANFARVNALPFRAYNLVFNQWFRDEDVDPPLSVPTGDGPDTYTGVYALARARKRHDYFTTVRPWLEKPSNNTLFPGTMSPLAHGQGYYQANRATPGAPVTGLAKLGAGLGAVSPTETGGRVISWADSAAAQLRLEPVTGWPDVRVLVNDMRTAMLMQVFAERNARGGTRYTELIREHFGVVSPDARLQRPEYLGGGRTLVVVNPVAQTSASGIAGTTTKLAELSAFGTGYVSGHGFSRSFTEHGTVLGLVLLRSYLTYQQGIERMWFRRSREEFYWPALAHLGEQAVLSQEIYADGSANDKDVFGYQERWSEYKYKPSRTSGYFRSTVATPLDQWHLGQKFTGRPVLNTTFIEENPPVSRVLQVATNFGEDFLLDTLFDLHWARCMPMYSIPGIGVGKGL